MSQNGTSSTVGPGAYKERSTFKQLGDHPIFEVQANQNKRSKTKRSVKISYSNETQPQLGFNASSKRYDPTSTFNPGPGQYNV